MRRTLTLGLAPLLALAACSDDAPPATVDAPVGPTNPGFVLPTAVTKANQETGGAWMEIGDANWSCLNTASTDAASTQAISLSGQIRDFQNGTGVGPATITAFPGIELGGNAGTATSDSVAATRGNFSNMNLAMLPSGTTRYGFKLEAAGSVKTYLLNQYLDPAAATQNRNMSIVSESTANALPALVGVTRDPAKGVLAGAMRDCDGNEVSNAVATVSSVAGSPTHLTGALSYYFNKDTGLPARNSAVPVMSANGLFVVLELPPQTAPAFIQVWGFTSAADLAMGEAGLKLLAELASPVEGNAVITGSIEPKRN